MNENLPPAVPDSESPQAPLPTRPPSPPPSPKVCFGLGVLLFVISSLLAFAFPPFVLVGLLVAFLTLFFAGYRCVFVGYITVLGVILLGATIYCANHPLRFD